MVDRIYERRVSPFEGEPETICGRDELQRHMICVHIRELTPERLKRAEALSTLFLIISIVAILFTAKALPILLIIGWPAALLGTGVLQQYLYQALRIETRVTFTPTEFKVLRHGRWDVYDRRHRHSFVMLKHDRARAEREEQECRTRAAQAKGLYPAFKRYYDDSYHMVLEYFGQRHDIATVFDEKRARAVIARLQACDAMMDSQIRMGESHVLSPEEEWGAQPGGLPGRQS